MRSLSSTVSDNPSRCDPSRSVVSNTSTDAGVRDTAASDMFVPVLVAIDLAADGGVEGLLDLARHRTRLTAADQPVVHRPDRHDLGGGAGQERLVGRVEVRAQDVAD